MIWEILLSTLRMSTPLIFAAMAGLLGERSGVINIALEGLMLIGAFSAAAGATYLHSAAGGWIVGGFCGLIFIVPMAWLCIQKKSDQVVVGIAMNLLALGLIPFLSKLFFNSTGSTPSLPIENRFGFEPIVLAWLLVALTFFFLNYIRLGLWVTLAGEKPESLKTAGISTEKVRWLTLLTAGVLAAWGGASLSLFLSSSYSPQMSGGRGFMALAALILGRWRPLPVALACVFFGLADAIQIRLQGILVMGVVIPVQFVQMLPYLATIVALAGFMGHSRPPQALGKQL